MKILISCVPFDRGRSGISAYIRNLVAELEKQGHELTLIVEHNAVSFFPGKRLISMPKIAAIPVISMFYHLFVLPLRLLGRNRWDFCIIAAANRRSFAFYPLFTLAVAHDLSQYHIPGKYGAFRTFYIKHLLPFFVRRANQVIAISQSTRRDLIEYWKIPADRITVCLNGLTLFPEQEPRWLSRHGLKPKSYILYVSRIEHPGKNHLNLLKAYEMLPEALTGQYALVLAGADWPGAEAVHRYAEQSPLKSRIIFTGFIANDEMREAYINAACYVFPSFFEGFGLSLIEAMHYEIPCCCSDNSSLGELGEGAALLFPPDAPGKITEALQLILSDEKLRSELVDRGRERARMFDWGTCAEGIVSAAQAALRLK